MNEQVSLSTKTPIIGALFMFVLLICAALVVNWDSQFAEPSGGVAEQVRYLGERGFYHPPVGQEELCKAKYSFWAYIKGNVIQSSDESMSFLSVLDEEGELKITGSHLIPVSAPKFLVTGPIEKARMYSELCGEGYFKLQPQNDT